MLHHIACKGALVTFIIPSKGRTSLTQSLSSLLVQSRSCWCAFVLGDGVTVRHLDSPSSPRIRYTSLVKSGTSNHAGTVRNHGMALVSTEWVAFLDDDDTVASTYVERLIEEIHREPQVQCVVFRMYRSWGNPGHILPKPGASNFVMDEVGISFAIRKRLYDEGFLFTPSAREDFHFLDKIRGAGLKMVLSEYLTYFVRLSPVLSDVGNFTRGVIN